jgi:peptide deformylase
MATMPIITAPDARLKQISTHVDVVDDAVRRLMDDMLETMYQAPGIGLSAIQVEIPKRIVVLDVAREGETPDPLYMVNPEITWSSEELAPYDEGCLSLPEHYAEILRPEAVEVSFLNYDGVAKTMRIHELLSRCVQHELDHLDGILFVDHLSAVKRNMIIRKLTKAKRQKIAV